MTTTGHRTPTAAMVKVPFQVVAIVAMFSAPVGIGGHKCGRATCSCANGQRRTTGQRERQGRKLLDDHDLCPSENGEHVADDVNRCGRRQRMIRIAITAAGSDAITSTLPRGRTSARSLWWLNRPVPRRLDGRAWRDSVP